MIEEQPVGHKKLFAIVMEPQKAFASRTMKQPNVWMRLPMKTKLSKVELKGWGDNAPRSTPPDSQCRE
jgi:hypothetical protein